MDLTKEEEKVMRSLFKRLSKKHNVEVHGMEISMYGSKEMTIISRQPGLGNKKVLEEITFVPHIGGE